MAKLRKMLGKIDEPAVVALKGLIETQSKSTLANWAVECVENRYIGIYEKAYPNDLRLRDAINATKDYLAGNKKLNELKVILRDSRQIAAEAEGSPAAQAAARAISTACAVIQTPTNALGFTFYGAAATVYDELGLSESADIYDEKATGELEGLLESLQRIAVPDEENPVKIKWNC